MSQSYSTQAERYLILIEGGPPTNYSAWSPDVPGCVATGDTVEECAAQMREALAFHIEELADHGDPIPPPSVPGVYVDPAAARA